MEGEIEEKIKEYIYYDNELDSNEDEIFIGWIRNHSKELIRCKDCKHWTFGENGVDGTADGICDALKILTDETFYCAESERNEE